MTCVLGDSAPPHLLFPSTPSQPSLWSLPVSCHVWPFAPTSFPSTSFYFLLASSLNFRLCSIHTQLGLFLQTLQTRVLTWQRTDSICLWGFEWPPSIYFPDPFISLQISFSSRLSKIQLCICAFFHYLLSVDGHPGRFNFLDPVSGKIGSPLVHAKSDILGLILFLLLNFWETPNWGYSNYKDFAVKELWRIFSTWRATQPALPLH